MSKTSGITTRATPPASRFAGYGLRIAAFPLPMRFKLPGAALDLLSHMFLFGLPIAMAARRAMDGGSSVGGSTGRA